MPKTTEEVDPRIDKRRVTMTSAVYKGLDDAGKPYYETHESIDYVPPDILDAYVANARTKWQNVDVSDEPDAGPGGYDGRTSIPEHLPVPNAGTIREAEGDALKALQEAEKKSGGGSTRGARAALFLNMMFTLAFVVGFMRFAVQTAAMKNILSDAYKGAATHGALYTTAPGATPGTEVTGGSPAYARKALTWGASSNGVVSATAAVFDVPSGTTVVGAGLHSAITAGTYYDGASVTSQAFASQGTYSVTFTYTQT
jgi:hypothetical protein